ncbi:hypothetical protein Bca4012_061335 [Brassica carinata]
MISHEADVRRDSEKNRRRSSIPEELAFDLLRKNLRQRQQCEKQVALSEIDYSRKVLLEKLKDYKGKELQVLGEASTFAGERVDYENDLLLPPYPVHPPPLSLGLDNKNNGYLPSKQKISDENGFGSGHVRKESPHGGSNHGVVLFLGSVAKIMLPIIGVISILSASGYGPEIRKRGASLKLLPGKDHLLPWIRGIKKMKESLPPQILNEKLPRFLQKCAQSFESDKRYRNDSRYIRVWLQLMDFVDDPRALLRTMEGNSIGTKRSLFYQAYALHYEKMKRFEDAEKMYRLGVQKTHDELQKSYLQFLSRMERHKKKKTQRHELKVSEKHQKVERSQKDPRLANSDDTPVLNFVDKAIVGKPEAENACHHGKDSSNSGLMYLMYAYSGYL